ncbi:MAG: undecaprenyl/decaprenyl-phosphate alpha-N-acetylglucosaminyl 1-phosphate transferase [Coriobacteriia bacterium]|nr:undecaprenyl/decaprenyl-phosphate alpha-N-acetylglucosaminyl 1-phosphate transferase [Coriobacteriia bacterium]
MSIRHYLGLIAVAVVVTQVVTPIVRWLSMRFGLMDRPNARKVHKAPISRIGGVAIYLGIAAAVVVQAIGEFKFGWSGSWGSVFTETSVSLKMGVVFAGITCVFLVGLVDDIFDIQPLAKLVGQIIAAGLVTAGGLNIEFVGNPVGGGLLMLGLLSVPVTILYLVGFANVINLIDGLDGLAAGISLIAATSLLVLAAQGNRLDAALLAAALIGACMGFLRHNFHPASIFMGDSGAMLLGFTLGVVSLLGVMKTTAAIALAVPLLIVGLPIFDTAAAIIRRLRHKRPFHEADKGHIHHRLLGRGFGHRETVLIIYLWSVILAFGAYTVRYAPGPIKLGAFIALFAITAVMAYWLGLYEFAHGTEGDRRPSSRRQG